MAILWRLARSGKGYPFTVAEQCQPVFYERIIVHLGVQGRNRFDPQRLEPIWRV